MKGACLKHVAGVTGSGFIVLAATLASLGTVPVASIALILGVDRFRSEARMHRHLNRETDAEADDPEAVLVEHELEDESAELAPRRAPA
ncbi:MAG TPA: hypothetical protein VM422_02265 [Amaricoccus sp.]|nr:hypothetical protein [Amaricoccus sp.]